MPIVMIFRDPKIVHDAIMKMISEKLPAIIVSALDIPEDADARLVSKDIRMKVFDRRPDFDFNADPLEILIYANDYPRRREHIDERIGKIADGIRDLWPDAKGRGFVWTLPMGGFAKL